MILRLGQSWPVTYFPGPIKNHQTHILVHILELCLVKIKELMNYCGVKLMTVACIEDFLVENLKRNDHQLSPLFSSIIFQSCSFSHEPLCKLSCPLFFSFDRYWSKEPKYYVTIFQLSSISINVLKIFKPFLSMEGLYLLFKIVCNKLKPLLGLMLFLYAIMIV